MCLSMAVRTDFMLLQYVFESLQVSHLQEATLKREGSSVQTGPARLPVASGANPT